MRREGRLPSFADPNRNTVFPAHDTRFPYATAIDCSLVHLAFRVREFFMFFP